MTDGLPDLPPHDEFYGQFTERNRGLIPPEEQEALRRATILVAGCGSIGGAAVEPLIRLGAEHLVLAEPDAYDLHNMNRQSVRILDIGRNKAAVFAERMAEINPYATVEVHDRGIDRDNVEDLVRGASVIVDGVDVTTKAPLEHKFALHRQAKRFGIPVMSGYDVAGRQCLLMYDYRRPGQRVLDGKVTQEEIGALGANEFLARVVPLAAVPVEIVPILLERARGESRGYPQLVYTANLFGVLVTRAVLDVLAGRQIRRRVVIDVNDVLRPTPVRLRVGLSRLGGLVRVGREVRRAKRRTGQDG
jgi:hypothetical protein